MDGQKRIKFAFYIAVIAWLISIVFSLLGIGVTPLFSGINLASGVTAETGRVILGIAPFDIMGTLINFLYIFIAAVVIAFIGGWIWEKGKFLRQIPFLGNNKIHFVAAYQLFYGTLALWVLLGIIAGFSAFTWTLGLGLAIYYMIIALTFKWAIGTFDIFK